MLSYFLVETIIDQLDTVNSNSSIEKVNNPEKVTKLLIKNYNNNSNWENLQKFTNLEVLHIENCWVDNFTFFSSISKLQKLATFKYNEECFFKKSEKKTNIKFSKLNKIIFICNKKDDPDLSLLSLYDKENLSNNFINSFPNYPVAYQNINEIEFVNYEDFLEKVKEEDYDYLYTDISEGKNVFFNCDIYNLLRLKNLKNLKFCEKDEDILNNKILTEKILSLPNTQKININNHSIQKIRDKLTDFKTLFLNFKYYPPEERNFTNVNKHSSIKNALEVHWPSQYYQGYSKLFDETLKSKFDNVIISPTTEFFEDFFEYFEGSVDFYENKLLKNKTIKKITFEFDDKKIDKEDNTYSWSKNDRYHGDYFNRLIKKTIEKKIKVIIDFKNFNKNEGLNSEYKRFIEFFNFFILVQSDENLKNYLEINNFKIEEINKFIEKVYLDEIKTIIVIDDQSKSKALKKFKDIELLDVAIDGWDYMSTYEGPIDFEKATGKHEHSFHDFFEYAFFEHWDSDDFRLNPGCCVPIVRKSYLDKSKKIIFKNLESIHFKYLDKDSFPNAEKIFKNKVFEFPKSINFSKVKNFSIMNSPPCSLNSLEKLEKLEKLYFENNVNQKDINWCKLPTFKNLKKLKINLPYPIISENRGKEFDVKNIENSTSLEEVELYIGESLNYEETRWNTTNVDLSNFGKLKKLKKLKLNTIDQTLIKNLDKLESLEDLEIVNPCMITANMHSDDGTIHEPLTEKDFHFIKDSKKLKRLKIFFPRFGEESHINLNVDKFLSLINPNIEILNIDCNYEKDKLHLANKWYLQCIAKFKNIVELDLDIGCNKGCDITHDYSSKDNSLYQKEIRKREKNAKNPVIVDLKKLRDLKKLSNFMCSFDENIGTRIENVQELNNINFNITISNYNQFLTEDLEKIFENKGTVREKYLYNYQKNNPKENVDSRYSLPEENKKEYDELESSTESNLKINNRSLLKILNERIQEKHKVKK